MYGMPLEVQMAASIEKREIEFYASAFGVRDYDGMEVQRGAFSKSLQERLPTGQIKLYRDHAIHCGVIRQGTEDDFGLHMVGYASKTRDGDEMLEQIRDGSLSRASFRARVLRAQFRLDSPDADGNPVETLVLTELDIKEAGPVNLDPANPLATVIAVKSAAEAELVDRAIELPVLLRALASAPDPKTDLWKHSARAILRAFDAAGTSVEQLRALLAPATGTSRESQATPPPATPAEISQADTLAQLGDLLRTRRELLANLL